MKDPYKILQLSEDATPEQLKAQYELLKARYSEQRFMTGEAGNEGAKNLMELEQAWKEVSIKLEKMSAENTYGGNEFGQIDELIKNGKYDEAQGLLDKIQSRTAQWHYLQSIVFYKRDWLVECRKQLMLALNLDPNNSQYKSALEKLDMVMGNPNANAQNIGVDPNSQTINNPQQGMMGGNMLSNCCLAYCITDCCCNMTRCC